MRWLSGVLLIAGISLAGGRQPPQATGAIAGRVADRHGREFIGATITARPPTPGRVFTTESRHDGTYRLTVPSGRYIVTVTVEGLDGVRRHRVTVAPGATHQFDATLDVGMLCECIEPDRKAPRTGMFIGSVADAGGNPLPSAVITVTGKALSYRARGYADATGHYSATLPPGEYTLSFSYPGFETLTREDRTVLGGWSERLSVRLETASEPSTPPDDEPLRQGCHCPGRVFRFPVRD